MLGGRQEGLACLLARALERQALRLRLQLERLPHLHAVCHRRAHPAIIPRRSGAARDLREAHQRRVE